MKISDLMYTLAEVKPQHRNKTEFDFRGLTVYHITSAANIDSIREKGLQARSSRQSYDRPNAVYFFVDKDEVNKDNANILGAENCKILKVTIPADAVINKMVWDGLYNVSFGTYSAVQFLDNVPAEWIVDYSMEG